SDRRHAGVADILDRVVLDQHAGGAAILQFDAATAAAVEHVVVGDRDVGLQTVPDHDAAAVELADIVAVEGDVVDLAEAIGVDGAETALAVLHGQIDHPQAVVATGGIDAAAGRIDRSEVLHREVLDRYILDVHRDADAGTAEAIAIDDRQQAIAPLQRQRPV